MNFIKKTGMGNDACRSLTFFLVFVMILSFALPIPIFIGAGNEGANLSGNDIESAGIDDQRLSDQYGTSKGSAIVVTDPLGSDTEDQDPYGLPYAYPSFSSGPTPMSDDPPSAYMADLLDNLGVIDAWSMGYSGDNVKVAVVDTGVDFGHPDLQDAYAVVEDVSSPYYGWSIAFDPKSMAEYLKNNDTRGTFFANMTKHGNGTYGFELVHPINVEGFMDWGDIEVWGHDTRDTGSGDPGGVKKEYDLGDSTDPVMAGLYVTRDDENWYFGFPTYLPDFKAGSPFSPYNEWGNITIGIFIDVDNETSGSTYSPLEKLIDTNTSHSDRIHDVAFSPDGSKIATLSRDRVIKVWWVSNATRLYYLTGHTDAPYSLAFSPDGSILASVDKNEVLLWDMNIGTMIDNISYAEGSGLYEDKHPLSSTISFSENGTWLGVSANKYIHVFNVTTRQRFGSIKIFNLDDINSIAFSPNGSHITTGNQDGTIKIFSINDIDTSPTLPIPVTPPLFNLVGHTSDVYGIDYSHNGTLLVSCSRDDTVRLWDMTSPGTQLFSNNSHGEDVYAVEFSPDGLKIASVSKGRTDYQYLIPKVKSSLILWNLTGEVQFNVTSGLSLPMNSVSWSNNTAYIATGGADQAVRIWNSNNGTLSNIMVQYKPDYALFANAMAYIDKENKSAHLLENATLFEWNESMGPNGEWEELGNINADLWKYGVKNGSQGYNDGREWQFNEIALPRGIIGDPEGIAIEIFSVGLNVSHALDTVPSDKNVYPDLDGFGVGAWPKGDGLEDPQGVNFANFTTSLSTFAYGKIATYFINESVKSESQSGDFHFGIHPSPYIVAKYGALGLLLVDSTTANVYDKLYIDFNNNRIFEPGDVVVSKSNPIAVYDYFNASASLGTISQPNPDGYPDLSGGMLYFITDGQTPLPYSEKFIERECLGEFNLLQCDAQNVVSQRAQFNDRAIPGNGDVIMFMGEFGVDEISKLKLDHGTKVAGTVAARGVLKGGIAKGTAPNSTIIGVANAHDSRYVVEGWYFASEGYDGEIGTGDDAQVVTVAFNYPKLYSKYGTGAWDPYSRYADYISSDYSRGKSTFVVSGGEYGFGYGSIGSPAGGPNIISVGLATDFTNTTGGGYHGDISVISSRGPTPSGVPKPDVASIGKGNVIQPLNGAFTDGSNAVTAGPQEGGYIAVGATTGILALTFEAFYGAQHLEYNETILETQENEQFAYITHPGIIPASLTLYENGTLMSPASYQFFAGNLTVMFTPEVPPDTTIKATYIFTGEYPDLDTAKEILMSSSEDCNYDVFSQGAGLINATNAVLIASESSGVSVSPYSWIPGDYRDTEYDAFMNLLYPGESATKTFTLNNHGSPVDVEIYDEVFYKTGEYTFSNITKLSNSGDIFGPNYLIHWINSSGIFRVNGTIIPPNMVVHKILLDNPWNSSLWNNADLIKIRASTNYSKMYLKSGKVMTLVPSRYYQLILSDWSNLTGTGYPDPVNAINELNTINELVGTTDIPATSNVLEGTVHSPASRIHDGLVFNIKHAFDAGVPNIYWLITVEFYKKTNWSWMSIEGQDSVYMSNIGEQIQFDATVNVPSDIRTGSYEGAIKVNVYDPVNPRILTIPVIVNVASKTLDFSFGGNSLDLLYDNSRSFGGVNLNINTYGKLTERHSGDWRFYYVDIPTEGIFLNEKGLKLYVEVNWSAYIPTNKSLSDIDIYVLSKGSADQPSKINSARYGPYPLVLNGRSFEKDIPEFNTSTNLSQEVIAVDLKPGLNVIAIHNVLINGSFAQYENITGRSGWVRHTPEVKHISNIGWGKTMVDFISNIPFPEGVSASAIGPATTERYEEVEITQDYETWWNFPNWGEWMMRGNYTKIIQVESTAILDVHIWGKDDAPDLDLAVFTDEDKDGLLSLEEVEDIHIIKYGGSKWDYDADGDADEHVIWLNPPNGQYIIKVLGFTILGAKGHFDIEISLTLLTGEGYKIDEANSEDMLYSTLPSLPAYILTFFNMSWNLPGTTKPGEYKGAIRWGTEYSKGVITIPVTIVFDYVPVIPEGTELMEDGRFMLPDETVLDMKLPEKTVWLPDGRLQLPDGTILELSDLGKPWITGFTVFTTPSGLYRINHVDMRTTNDNTPKLIVSLSDDRGEMDWTSPRVYLKRPDATLDVTLNADIIVNFEDPDGKDGPLKNGYWSGSISYSISSPLPDGPYYMKYVVRDLAGNEAIKEFYFIIDTKLPSLTEEDISPEYGFSTTQTSITISGKTDQLAKVAIRDVNVTADMEGYFSAAIDLVPGINDISITSVDWFDTDAVGNLIPGNSNTKIIRIIHDVLPPTITSITNSTGTPTNKDFTYVAGVVSDDIGNATYQYSRDPTGLKVIINNAYIQVQPDGRFGAYVMLLEGLNTITLKAVDEAGNSFTASLNITKDVTPPTLSLGAVPLEVSEDEIEISGNAEAGSSVLVNGQFVPNVGGEFSFKVTLSEGLNTIKVEAFDSAGNSYTQTKYVTYAPEQVAGYIAYLLLFLIAVIVFLIGYSLGGKKKPLGAEAVPEEEMEITEEESRKELPESEEPETEEEEKLEEDLEELKLEDEK